MGRYGLLIVVFIVAYFVGAMMPGVANTVRAKIGF